MKSFHPTLLAAQTSSLFYTSIFSPPSWPPFSPLFLVNRAHPTLCSAQNLASSQPRLLLPSPYLFCYHSLPHPTFLTICLVIEKVPLLILLAKRREVWAEPSEFPHLPPQESSSLWYFLDSCLKTVKFLIIWRGAHLITKCGFVLASSRN